MSITVFKNENLKVRTFLVNEEPLFIAKDVAVCLQYKNTNESVTVHCKKKMLWKNVKKMQGGSVSLPLQPNTVLIPESDVYRLILRSKSQNAEAFQD